MRSKRFARRASFLRRPQVVLSLVVALFVGCQPIDPAALPGDPGVPGVPQISLPSASTVISSPTLLSVTGSGIDSVLFEVDGETLLDLSNPPFQANLDPSRYENGPVMILVRVTMDDGTTTEASVEVTINNLPPPPPGTYPDNTWVKTPMSISAPAEYPGSVRPGSWGRLCYMPDEKKIILPVFYEDSNIGGPRGYSIYDNSLAICDLRTTSLRLDSVSAWVGGNADQYELSGQEGLTPPNRHTYSGMAYVPKTREVHWVAGANSRSNVDLSTTWAYSIDTKSWRKTGTAPGGTMYEGHLNYVPDLDRLVFLAANQVIEQALGSNTWTVVVPKFDAPYFWSGSSFYDPVRKRIIYFCDGQDSSHPRKLVSYDPAQRTFETLTADSPAPFGRITYHSKYDVYFSIGSVNPETWVYDPNNGQWSRVAVSGSVEGHGSTAAAGGYIAYDAENDLVAVRAGASSDWYLMRYVPD